MIKILTAQQMRELDAYTIKNEPVSPLDLMERAAQAVTHAITARWTSDVAVVVLAGPGNNGGDALAVARLLHEKGYQVTAYLFNTDGKLSGECRENRQRLAAIPEVVFTEVTDRFEPPRLDKNTLVVDGLFGIGLNKPLDGGFAQLITLVNASSASVVSIDMPSGLMMESEAYTPSPHIMQATLTLTFQQPKLPLLLADNRQYVGELEILDIGLSAGKLSSIDTDYILSEPSDFSGWLRPRDPFGHKGTFGHALIIAGKYGMAGAAILAARACLRSGVGKVTLHTPQMNNSILQIAVPEAVLSHDAADEVFSSPVIADAYSAVAIGCGIGTAAATASAFIEQVRRTHVPLLIDADGLNILSKHKAWIRQLLPDTVLTPHPAELRRLIGQETDDNGLLAAARELSMARKIYIILKGRHTAVCVPDGHIYFNPTGNSGMATAGSGDVLTGIITALLAGHYPVGTACRLGVFLHGLAGDAAAEVLGEESLTASDIISYLPVAFRRLREMSGPVSDNLILT